MRKKSNLGLYFSIFLIFAGIIVGFVLLSKVYTGPIWIEIVAFFVIVFILICLSVSLKRFFETIKEMDSDKKR